MSDSVGKISLDLEIQSDLNKQITDISKIISNNLKNSIESGFKGIFDNLGKSISASMKSIESNLNSSIRKLESSMNSSMTKIQGNMEAMSKQLATIIGNTTAKTVDSSLSKTMANIKAKLTNSFKAMFSSLKNVKMPTLDFGKPANQAIPKTTTTSSVNKTRGSPINSEALKAEIDNTAATLDVINRKIEQQQAKLLDLKESYNITFNQARKNKIEEQMLKTEASITKLIGQSDKLGFKLSDLEAKFASLGAEAKSTGNKIGLFNTVANGADAVNKKLSNSVKSSGNNMKKAGNSARGYHMGLGMVARQFMTWMVILPIVMKGMTAMATGLYNNLMTNHQFANSLAQIKTNLMVAFTPIYQAILPAINTLMGALSKATQYIASFISSIFGKTYQQSYQATQGLIDAKVAMGAYGDSAKKAAKDTKGALMGFDEINQLDLSKNNEGEASGGGSDVPTLVTPALDTSSVDVATKSLADRIKAYFGTFDFSNLINAFSRVRDAAMPIIDNIGQGLKWFFDNVLDPLAHWTISDLLPAFLDVLAGVLKVINPLLESFGRVAKLLWDNFLQPISSWTGGVIVDVLEGLVEKLTSIGDWMSNNESTVDNFTIILGSFATGFLIASAALAVYEGISWLATYGTTALGSAFKAVNWQLVLLTIAIGAVIAIVVLLVKNWDWVKEKCGEVWDWIKDKFQAFSDWIGSAFATDWTKYFGAFGNVINAFLGVIQTKIDAVKRIFGGVIDFVKGVFTGNWSQAWDGIKNVFGGIWDYISAAPKAALNLVIKAINWAIGKINKALTFSVPDWDFLPDGIQGKTFGINIPEIPQLAKGGVLDQPTLAMVGEAGKEAVVPLENNLEWVDKVGSMVGTAVLQAMNFSNGNSNNNSGGEAKIILDGQVCGRLLNPYIKSEEKRIGSSAITTV